MSLLLSGFLLGFSLVLDIGIANIALIRAGVHKGFIVACMIGLGATAGDMAFAMLSVTGITYFIEKSIIFQWVLWIVGTILLSYLSYQMFRESFKSKFIDLENEEEEKSSLYKYFFTGMGLVLSSPSGILWFATVGGSVVASTVGESNDLNILPFFLGFFIASILWGISLAWISSMGGKLLGSKLLQIFSLVSGFLFLYFAAKVFIDGLNNLV